MVVDAELFKDGCEKINRRICTRVSDDYLNRVSCIVRYSNLYWCVFSFWQFSAFLKLSLLTSQN